MKNCLNVIIVWLLAVYILLPSCTSPTSKQVTEIIPPIAYYSATDFSKVEKYDTHVHINTDDSSFINQAKKDIE